MGLFDKFFRKKSLQGVQSSGWRSIINEPFSGAWQRNQELKREDMAAFFAVFSCVTRISHDIANQPPSGGCELKLPFSRQPHLDPPPAAFGRL